MPVSILGNGIQYCNQETNPCSQGTYNLVGDIDNEQSKQVEYMMC